MAEDSPPQDQGWQEFVEGQIHADAQAPCRDDPAVAPLLEFPGLREGVGGRIAAALTQAIGLVRALTRVDLLKVAGASAPAQGLCLGSGRNAREPSGLLR